MPTLPYWYTITSRVGLTSRKLYDLRNFWIERAIEVIQDCQCESGCPACVGPVGEPGYGGKQEALALLKGLRYG